MYLFHSIRVHGHIMVKFKLSTYARYVLNLVAMFMVKIRNFYSLKELSLLGFSLKYANVSLAHHLLLCVGYM